MTDHDLEYVNANESYCQTCDKLIPNAHLDQHQEAAVPDRETAPPRSRFTHRPNGRGHAPVIQCDWCGETFNGWPGTYNHKIRHCLLKLIW